MPFGGAFGRTGVRVLLPAAAETGKTQIRRTADEGRENDGKSAVPGRQVRLSAMRGSRIKSQEASIREENCYPGMLGMILTAPC